MTGPSCATRISWHNDNQQPQVRQHSNQNIAKLCQCGTRKISPMLFASRCLRRNSIGTHQNTVLGRIEKDWLLRESASLQLSPRIPYCAPSSESFSMGLSSARWLAEQTSRLLSLRFLFACCCDISAALAWLAPSIPTSDTLSLVLVQPILLDHPSLPVVLQHLPSDYALNFSPQASSNFGGPHVRFERRLDDSVSLASALHFPQHSPSSLAESLATHPRQYGCCRGRQRASPHAGLSTGPTSPSTIRHPPDGASCESLPRQSADGSTVLSGPDMLEHLH